MGHYLICVCLFKHAASFQLCSVLSLLCICLSSPRKLYLVCFRDLLFAHLLFLVFYQLFVVLLNLNSSVKYCLFSHLLALFHCMVRHGMVRYCSLLGGFPLDTVPGTWYFFSTTSAEVPSEPYRYQNVTCKLC